MSADPRLDLAAGAPHAGEGGDRALLVRLLGELATLRRRVDALERTATIQTVAGPPTTSPRDGTPAVDTTNVRLYLRVNGAWRYTTLT